MSAGLATLAAVLLTLGAIISYLTAPNQQLRSRPFPAAARLPAAFGILAALGILLTLMGPATAVFAWATGLMLLWTLPPIVVAWLGHRKESCE